MCVPIRNATGVLFGVVQELCQCLVPLLKVGNLLNHEMLHIAKRDPVAPTPTSASPSPEPKEEKQSALQVPKEPCTSEPEEAAHLVGGLDLVWRRFPSVPLGFDYSHANQTHTGLARFLPLEA